MKLTLLTITSLLSVMSFGQTYSFTNASAEGRIGPTQIQVDSAYSGTTLDSAVTVDTNGIQEWTVPNTGYYRILANGAQGGAAMELGGKGATIEGQFLLTAGQVLKIVVGQMGINSEDSVSSGYSAGGGGGSFVIKAPYNVDSTILVIAGGGGGAGVASTSQPSTPADQVGIGGDTLSSGANGKGSSGSTGGMNGLGGTIGISSGASSGAGFIGNSVEYNPTNPWATEAFSFINGARGAEQLQSARDTDGGFGGGGAGAYGGGGGGGYSGGGAGHYIPRDCGGGGGGSFNAGINQINIPDTNTGMGNVVIEFICDPGAIDVTTSIANGAITVSQSGASYQWINCDNDSVLVGDTNQSFSPSIAGTYKVIVRTGAVCVDTSACIYLCPINITTTVAGLTITSDQSGASYQWIDCDNDSVLVGETGQSYTASQTGNYQVVVSANGCVDTSACVLVTVTPNPNPNGINGLDNEKIVLYPNPFNDIVHLKIVENSYHSIKITDLQGREVINKKMESNEVSLNLTDEPSGVYFLHLVGSGETNIYKIVKK